MFKKWSLLFLCVFFGFQAEAESFFPKYEDYVHLSEADKKQVVIKIMELAVEIESRYIHDVKTYGEHSPQVQKLKETLSRINNFLISSAYAAPPTVPKGWDRYAQDFKKNFLDSNGENCIFAGWPSKTQYNKTLKKTICRHPLNLSTTDPMRKSYEQGNVCGKSVGQIQCNPTLFGFQDNKAKPFCVGTSNLAQNAALDCMNLALKGSDKDVRLKILTEKLGHPDNKEILESLHQYVYQLCVCEKAPDKFDQSYHTRILPHRTCYGMMNMFREVSCGVEETAPLKNTDFFKNLSEHFYQKSSSAQGDDIDRYYKQLTIDARSSLKKEDASKFAQMCPNDPGITVTGPDKDKGITTSGVTSGATSGADGGAQGGTPGGADPIGDRYTCKEAICKKDAETYKCDFIIHDNKTDQSINPGEPKYEAPKDETVASIAVNATIDEKEVSLSCPVSIDGEVTSEENLPSLSLEITEKGDKTYTITATPKNDKGWKLVWTLELPKTLPQEEVKQGWDDPKAKKDDKPKEKTPSGLAPDSEPETTEEDKKEPVPTEDKDGKTPATPATDDPTKKDDKVPEDGKDKDGKTPATPAADDPTKKDDKVPEDGKDKDGKTPATPAADDSGKKGDKVPEGSKEDTPTQINQDRKKDDYKACAQLVQGDKKVPETPLCKQVDKVAAPAPTGQGGMMPQQQPAMRRASDTSALGIR